MKYLSKILFLLVVCFLFIPSVYGIEKYLVNIYLFYSDTCPHCASEKKLLNELEDKYDKIDIISLDYDMDS